MGDRDRKHFWQQERKSQKMDEKIKKLAQYIEESNYTVAVTGAGISIAAGGVTYAQMRRMHMHPGVMRDPDKMYEMFCKTFLDSMFKHEPSIAHKALREMEEKGQLQGIITTNEDCMHTIAGSRNVAEIQGSYQVNVCTGCGKRYEGYQIWNQGKMPVCESCGDTLLPYQLYSRAGLLDDEVKKAQDWISKAELIIVIGTNGYYGSVYWDYRRRDAKIVQINPGRTHFDSVANLNIKEASDPVFEKLMKENK